MEGSVDKLIVLRGDDIQITPEIILHQPTLNEVTDYGEARFFSTFYSLCSIPSDMTSVLWDNGVDFMKITDWQLFMNISRSFTSEDTAIMFGDKIDFSKMQPMRVGDTEEIVLVGEEIIVSEKDYLAFIPYVREAIGYVLKRRKAGNRATKMAMIDDDRISRNLAAKKEYESSMFSIVTSLVNTEEFGYTYKSAYDLTVYQLLKSYFQIQNKKSACALYQGSMSGFVDTSKISKDSFSWIYDEAKFK